ncbi:NAD(P)/FAD-dependent oxidoreductase [Nocardioides cavernae]|uniref:NAD(P)/FAD-dependent oxidoreductase n=1 Tax=Nocardioides cavernae TaxID=1921566 RepID=A0ABR8NG88_9ACTN|nr:NAD(P)/FAD-dependent oxidoreductase [Nocardioides cavernae]MBD3927138.1 NAD(P)/FAD-dependent oxidoreductase [Nocardioides cavernae]MBM7512858.1 geranylgeranyl reductase family protein [Nocardioides cavernae]
MSRGTATEHWDLVVVGAGPAGSATALGALAEDPGLRVLLLDRSEFPRDKSCGDGIAPHVLDALAPVGAADVVDGWAPLRDLELAHGDVSVAGPMRREVHVVPRRVLDARLVERAVAAGAVLRTHRATSLTRTDTPVVSGEVSADVVVGADGAHSFVRTALLGKRREPRAIAIRGYAPTTPEMAGRQVIRYGDRRQPSYAWAFDRGDGLANVGYGELLPGERHGGAPSRRLLLDQLELLVPGAASTGDDWRGHHLPLSSWRWDQPDGPVLLVGDAAGLVNPMTGEGIYYAVATGIAAGRTAARAVRAGNPAGAGAVHRRVVRALLGSHLRHTWAASRLAQSPRIVDAGIHAAGRDRHAFDALVELGLGDGRIDVRLAGGLLRSMARPGRPARPAPDLPSTPTPRGG